jgi:hypothetical protein
VCCQRQLPCSMVARPPPRKSQLVKRCPKTQKSPVSDCSAVRGSPIGMWPTISHTGKPSVQGDSGAHLAIAASQVVPSVFVGTMPWDYVISPKRVQYVCEPRAVTSAEGGAPGERFLVANRAGPGEWPSRLTCDRHWSCLTTDSDRAAPR